MADAIANLGISHASVGCQTWSVDAQVGQEPLGVIVHDELIGELGLLQQGIQISVVGDGERYVCVAAQDDGHALLAAEAQNLQIVVVGLHQSACRPEAGVVDLQECMRLGGRPYYGFVIQVGSSVTRMTYDVCPRIPDGSHHACCILLACAPLPADTMDARYAQVQHAVVELVQVQCAVGVQYIELCPQEQAYAVHLSGHYVQIAEVDGVAGSWYVGAVLCDTQYVQSLAGCFACHFLYGTEGMSTHHRVGVYVQTYLALLFLYVHSHFVYVCILNILIICTPIGTAYALL